MSLKIFFAVILTAFVVSAPAYSEPVADRFIGKVIIRNPEKLDGQAKKEIAAIAAKIKKILPVGTIKVVGDVPSAESPDEYLSKSVFVARNVATQLKTQLPGRYQIFIMASKYRAEKRVGYNFVEIHLYPHELKVEGAGFISSQVTSAEVPREREPVQVPALSTTDQPPAYTDPVNTPAYQGLLSSPLPDEEYAEATSKKERQREESENPSLANELVMKAKARAAEKMRRLEQEK